MSDRRGGSGLGVVAVGATLGAVVLASRGMPGEERTSAAYSAAMSDRMLFTVFVVLMVVATALVIWSAWPDGAQRPEHEQQPWWRRYVTSLAVMLLFVAFGAIWQEVRPGEDDARTPEVAERRARTSSDGGGTEGDGADWLPASGTATAMLATVVLALGVAAVGRRLAQRRAEELAHRRAAEEDERAGGGTRPHDVEVLPDEFDEADLAAEPDARRAVRLAYALLERRLEGTPAARPVEATPQEWLAVLRRRLPAADEARLLTTLYERARFGGERREITEDDRNEATRALRALTNAGLEPSTSTGGRGS